MLDSLRSRARVELENEATDRGHLAARHIPYVSVLTDDVMLLAQTAIGHPVTPSFDQTQPAELESLSGLVLANACRWYAFEVTEIDDSEQRVEISCYVVSRGRLRDFVGWNRAMHAVLEAAILATRVHMLPKDRLLQQLQPLATIVDKTASDTERRAFALLSEFIASAPSPEEG